MSIRFSNVVGTGILGWSIFEEFFESFEVIRLDSLFNEYGHGELLGYDDFIGRNSSITGNDTSSEFAGLFAHYFASNRAFLST